MKSIIKLFFVVCVLVVAFFAYNSGTFNHILTKLKVITVYDVDYIKRHKKTLDAMFENNWTVKSKEEKKVVPAEICEHVDSTPFKYTEWTIQYTNAEGKLQEFILNNKDKLSQQIEDYIEDYVPKFYEKYFFNKYLKNIPLTGASFVFGSLDDVSVDPQDEENKVRVAITEKYRKGLETPEGTICFSKFTPANAFEMCPMYLSIHVSIDDGKYSDSDKQTLEKYTRKQVDLMTGAMNGFANNKINAEITVVSNRSEDTLYDGKDQWAWYYIQGTSKNEISSWFEAEVYNGYKGVFW